MPFDCSIDIRVFPIKNRFSPMLVTDFGYAIESDNLDASGGLLLNVGAGGRINLTQKRALSLILGYKAQRLTLPPFIT